MTSYDARAYWEGTLDDDTLAGVGYPYLPRSFNRALYGAMTRAANRTLVAAGLWDHLSTAKVLDVGSGSGYWLDYWRARNAFSIAALELTSVAAERLRDRNPDVEVRHGDISDLRPDVFGPFDVISVMSVLLHLKEDERFVDALVAIAALLEPDGLAIVIDPLVTEKWWGAPFGPASNSKARTHEEWRAATRAAGLILENLTAVTWLLAEPVDTRRRVSFRLLTAYWRLISRLVYGSERRGAAAAATVGLADRALLRWSGRAPSTKCFVLRRAG